MGGGLGKLSKFLDTPVNVNEWNSLKTETVKILTSFHALVNEIEKWPLFHKEYETRYEYIRHQWISLHTMLMQMIRNKKVPSQDECATWLRYMRQEMDRTAEKYNSLRRAKLITIEEKEEPLLDSFQTGIDD